MDLNITRGTKISDLCARAMKKQVIDQTSAMSPHLYAGTLSKLGKSRRGPKEHHPTGSSPAKASMPCALPFFMRFLKAFFALAPLISFQILRLSARHHMHQQPPQAPFGPNRRSTAGHKLGRNSSKRMF